ncbi:MAG: hypothetical protein N4J56_000612 [Chroococcidiopsis sp. SAG 2025]|nr:hypothetical protein [Chroococcidiopsis sp. SAG 2025]
MVLRAGMRCGMGDKENKGDKEDKGEVGVRKSKFGINVNSLLSIPYFLLPTPCSLITVNR